MVNKFVFDSRTSSVNAVGITSGRPWLVRGLRLTLIAAAIGASIVGFGFAARQTSTDTIAGSANP